MESCWEWQDLIDVRHERDSCGVGFIADLNGRPTHRLVRQAVVALTNLTHRGAVSSDGLSGDGAGILSQIPHRRFCRELQGKQDRLQHASDLGVGVFFFPGQDERQRALCQEIVEEYLSQSGLEVLRWRDVPTDPEALGQKARATCPWIRQVLVAPPAGLKGLAYERLLYLTRRRIEKRVRALGIRDFFVPSFSHRTIVYKGLMVAPQLDRFYQDLADPEFESAIVVFHQRYSTNTFPQWALAQPFRFLAHNGEINTLEGNTNWMRAREPELYSAIWGDSLKELLPVVDLHGSDSLRLDNVFELLVLSGRDPLHAMCMLIPEAYQQAGEHMDDELHGFYEYHALLMEPWDGPAAIAFTDGQLAAAVLDRNGLRPMRYWVLEDGWVVAGSEAGLIPAPDDQIVEKGRLGPGKILAVDVVEHRLLREEEIKKALASRRPYRAWVKHHLIRPHELQVKPATASDWFSEPAGEMLIRKQLAFGYGLEDIERILLPMCLESKEPVGSMGDDTPVAVLSEKPQLLYRYFKQKFAQVTNPPIDPLRERVVMSLNTAVGPRGCLLDEHEEAARLIKFPSPIISEKELNWLRHLDDPRFRSRTLQARFPVREGASGLEPAVEQLCREAERAVDEGCSLVILSDREVDAEHAPIPMLLATAAVHHHLIGVGKRMRASILCEVGDAREDHHFACLIGYGAALICPYLAFATVASLAEKHDITPEKALQNYKAAIDKGILKIMSKMGISTVNSYRGAQIFEIIGLDRRVVDRYFTGTVSRVQGAELVHLARDVLAFHQEAFSQSSPRLFPRGLYRYYKEGEYHAFNPTVFKALHKAVRTQEFRHYQEFAAAVDERPPCHLRDLLTWKRAPLPVPLEEVEPATEIVKRFCTQAMSHGALSRECHEVLAVAMNRLGAKSNSGEGGEDPIRFKPYDRDRRDLSYAEWYPHAGDWSNSAIKQVASGRFGVTPYYLISAQELEIKMSQGSKPGEGGQIPGHKVTEEIARIRRSVPGVTLISPPPHHDIYSIEDLAQLIYDLKRVNRKARICVKLVSVAGVGVIAAGVAKGYADTILISGCDGGTGASPLSSIKNAGMPWELGLAEAQQVLVENDLRGRVILRVDGGLKSGRDVVLAALLGAEEFGFGTAAVVAAGCVMARQCHLNTCPVGVATQRSDLRARFPGTPEHVISYMLFVAEHVRLILAEMGFRRLADIIGRTDLLELRRDVSIPKGCQIDLSAILFDPDPTRRKPHQCTQGRNDRPEPVWPLDEVIWRDCQRAVEAATPIRRQYSITNRDASVGARLSGEIARLYGEAGLPPNTIQLYFRGVAGQSFGAFCNRGMRLVLEGEAQDYVGKGMFGGEIVLYPPKASRFASHKAVIMGNTVLYGATGGSLFAAGLAGERLCVRNSGAKAVVEGCGDHGCEYMTNGVVVVLGPTGRNFGAGMSGGVAYVLDVDGRFPSRYNPAMVGLEKVEHDIDEQLLRLLVERHFQRTGSARARWVLEHWNDVLSRFWKVVPHPSHEEATAQDQDPKRIEQEALQELLAEDGVPEPLVSSSLEGSS
jgi:glutamate synthase (ferredoxin)